MLGLCSILDTMAKKNVCLVEFVGGFGGVEENNGSSLTYVKVWLNINYFGYISSIKSDQVLTLWLFFWFD